MRKKVAALVGLTLLLIVAGCTPREYGVNMQLGNEQLQEEKYLEAYEAFASAYKDKNTEEAKELMELSKFLADGISRYKQENYDTALASFEKAAGYKAKTKEGKELVRGANEWVKKVSHAQSGSSSKEEGQVVSKDPVTHEKQNIDVPETAKDLKKDQTNSELNSEPSKTDSKVTNEKNDDPKVEKKLTVKEAEQLVKDFIKIQAYPQLRVQYDHDDEKGDYIFQVFESVEDGEYGHTATWGWYGVNPKTKEVYDIM